MITKKEVVYKGKWISTNIVHYRDPLGVERQWESVGRTTKIDSASSDAVVMASCLKRRDHPDCFVMVKQFRPPVECYTLEFPAGLIDKKDGSMKKTALRELYEETGYRGSVKKVVNTAPTPSNSGLLESTLTMMYIEIDGDSDENSNVKQHLDEGEFVEVVYIPIKDFTATKLNEWAEKQPEKTLIDSRVLAQAFGMELASTVVQ